MIGWYILFFACCSWIGLDGTFVDDGRCCGCDGVALDEGGCSVGMAGGVPIRADLWLDRLQVRTCRG